MANGVLRFDHTIYRTDNSSDAAVGNNSITIPSDYEGCIAIIPIAYIPFDDWNCDVRFIGVNLANRSIHFRVVSGVTQKYNIAYYVIMP